MGPSGLWQFSDFPVFCFVLFWWPSQFWSVLIRDFVEYPSIRICSKISLRGFLRGRSQRPVPFSSHHNQGCMPSAPLTTVDVDLDRLLRRLWLLHLPQPGLAVVKLLSPTRPAFHIVLCAGHTQRVGSYAALPWRQSVHINYLEFLRVGELSLLSRFFIYSIFYLYHESLYFRF